jgi:hypothetical protein
MDKAIQSLEQQWDDRWDPLPDKFYDIFRNAVVEGSLLVGTG